MGLLNKPYYSGVKIMTAVPAGFHTVAPYLFVNGAAKAIEFYKRAFGAVDVGSPFVEPQSGKILHAEIRIGDSVMMLADETPEWGNRSPATLGGSSVFMHLYVSDVDATVERAVAAGAKILIPVKDQFYGDRSGRLADPFGHIWIVSTHKEDVPADEMQKRFAECMQPTAKKS